MKAEDTVIKSDELGLAIIKHPELPMGQAIAIEQAKISFKIGKTEGVAESLIPSLKAIEDSRKAGAKEERERIIARTEVKMARVYGKDLNTGKRALLRYELKPDDWQALKEEGDGERVK